MSRILSIVPGAKNNSVYLAANHPHCLNIPSLLGQVLWTLLSLKRGTCLIMDLTGPMMLAASPSWREQKVCNDKSLGVTGNASEGGKMVSN